MISILCVYNDKSTLEDYLLPGLRQQTVPFEELLCDNSDGRWASAAAALNDLGAKAQGRYLMVVHQDVRIEDERFLENAEAALDSLLPFGVAGVAGCGPNSEETKTAISCGVPPRRPGALLLQAEDVQTVDECLFFIPVAVFCQHKFDAVTCNDWHLYAVDYCLSTQLEAGLRSLAVPLYVYHLSAGVLNRGYFASLARVLAKYRTRVARIHTTIGTWKTDWPRARAVFYRAKLGLYSSGLGQLLVRVRERLAERLR